MDKLKDLKLVDSNDPLLRKIAYPVSGGDDELMHWELDQMWSIMRKKRGMGLAAPQVGVRKRMIIAAFKFKGSDVKIELINPTITRRFGGKVGMDEGCLSFPGESVNKARYKHIQVTGFDRHWKMNKFRLSGMPARIVQHEVDHLNGVTIK